MPNNQYKKPEELSDSGTLQDRIKGAGGEFVAVVIDGVTYEVADFVRTYVASKKEGRRVWFNYRVSSDGKKCLLTRIEYPPKDDRSLGTKPTDIEEGTKTHGIFRKSDGINAIVTVEGKNRILCLTQGAKSDLEKAQPLQGIEFILDTHNFIMPGVVLGSVLASGEGLPPIEETGKRVTKQAPIAGNTSSAQSRAAASDGEKGAKEPMPPGGIQGKQEESRCHGVDSSTSPSQLPPDTQYSIKCTVNLQNYESIGFSVTGSASDASALEAWLVDRMMGHGLPGSPTNAAILGYVKRVFGGDMR
jgi:hypothetical protein